MITERRRDMFKARGRDVKDYTCNSGDTKPVTGVADGSICLEVDTGYIYAFDGENEEWNKIN